MSAGSTRPARVREPIGPIAAFVCCTLIWSTTFLFIRIGSDTVPPVWAATLRLALASVLLALIALATRQPWPRGRPLKAALWFGFIDFGVSLPLLYWGEAKVSSAVASILFATIPLTTAAFARAFGLETIGRLKLLGGCIGLAGVAVLFSGELKGALPPVRLVAVFLAATTASLAGVMLKRAPEANPITMNALAHGIGAVACFGVSLALGESHAIPRSAEAWVPILYLTVIGSVVAFVVFAWLVQRWNVVRISFISVIIPVTASLLGATVRHERLGPQTLVGGAIVLLGLTLAILGDQRAARR